VASDDLGRRIDEFVARSAELNGQEVRERPAWNTQVTADAIRHFAWGTSDDNPLWLDPVHAAATRYGRRLAPPAFLISVLYPFLHGAPLDVPLASLIEELELEWLRPVLEGDALRASSRQTDVFEGRDRRDRRLVYVVSETRYWNQRDELVGRAVGTLVRVAQADGELVTSRAIHRYGREESDAIRKALESEVRSGARGPTGGELAVGQELPPLVRGPLTIGDLVCWQAAIGPSYRAGALGYRDSVGAPHTAATHPVTGWPVKHSQQHEDFLLAAQRGMPAPFDNGAMRFAWIAPLLTNWAGDDGFLRRLRVHVDEPVLYGDTSWYAGRVTGKREVGDETAVAVAITGTNQLGERTTTAEAEMILPSRRRAGPSGRGPAAATPAAPEAHELFEAHARREPDAVAVVADGEVLTRGELNGRANRLAHHLRARGAGRGALVGLLLDRTPDAVVALLAVLKSGAAYLPLDPELPARRAAWMLENARARFLVSQARFAPPLARDGLEIVAPDEERRSIAACGAEDPRPLALPDDLACVIYTSGSTSTPRAVAVTRRGLALYVPALVTALGVRPEHVFLHTAAFSFSAAVRQTLLPLAIGAPLVMASDEERRDPPALLRLARERRVGVWDTVPAVLRQCLDTWTATDPDRLAAGLDALRLVLVTGEPLRWELARAWARRLGERARLVNLYSQTETVGTVACFEVPADGDGEGFVPLGRPLPGTRIEVLDERGRPAATGAPGEIHVGGERLARGYLDDPGLTALRFPPDPREPGARVHRTGDLGRFGLGGNLEFLARADRRLKIRGQGVSPEEVELALGRHADVREAVVVAQDDPASGPALVAYFVPQPGRSPAVNALRRFLAEQLPDAMVPAAFVALDALPRTPSGKLDRGALPAPSRARPRLDEAWAEPRTAIERGLAALFGDVLGLEQVGLHDDFFDLGGNSLRAAQLIARARARFGRELPLRLLFEARTVAAFARAVEEGLGGARPAVVARESAGPIPQSFSQQRVWFLEQLDPGTALYNVSFAARISGELHVDALRRTLEAVTARHEALRTTFAMGEGTPVQRVGEATRVDLPAVDLRDRPAAEREAEIDRQLDALARGSFDLTRGPLVRVRLLRLAERDHALLFALHHCVTDGWSRNVLLRELFAHHEAFASGGNPTLPPLAIQYGDFATAQRERLASGALDEQLAWWRARLAGAPARLDLPADHRRPSARSHRGARHPLGLSDELWRELESLGRRAGATPFMTLLAAFAALLHRYTGETDLLVGVAFSGRTHVELEPLIGFFVNFLPVRVSLAGDPGFLGLLERVRAAILETHERQEVPFERLVEELRPGRSLAYNPLCQVAAVARPPLPPLPAGRLRLEGIRGVDDGTSKFDLTLHVDETDAAGRGFFEYSLDLFEPETVERMARHLRTLVAGAAAAPSRPVSELALLPPEEHAALLGAAQGGRAAADPPSFLDAFASAVERAPGAIAVASSEGALRYDELDARARRLARRLRRAGVGPGVPVALRVERSLDMPVGLLGILRAGGAWVPLDPRLPAARAERVLRDSGTPVLLTQEGLPPLAVPDSVRVLQLGTLLALADEEASGDWEQAAPGDLAYVIYTSGSTGAPKGVQIEHRALASFVAAARELYALSPRDRVLQFATLAFDASVEEIFPCLAAGATLVLRSDEMLDSAGAFFSACAARRVSVASLPTAFWHELVAELGPAGPRIPACLRLVVIGGESARPEALARWRELAPAPVRLVNTYGPTEATVVATACDLTGDGAVSTPDCVPIGRPLPGVEAFVLDARGRPVPIGVPGELHLGGAGLARGYLGLPEVTAQRFVAHPFSEAPGARLYRTGDRARWRADGQLEFLGRTDRQLKIRGFRIEPEEIEGALEAHPEVARACVRLVEDAGGARRLVAYLEPAGEPGPDARTLRDWLRRSLPEPMIPAELVALRALPRTASGKLDERALPDPGRLRALAAPAPAAPRDAAERALARIWAELLGHDRIGIHDDFFDLGGHSLLGVRMFAAVERAFGRRLPLSTLFQSATIAKLAERLAQPEPGAQSAIVSVRPGGPRAPVFFLPSLAGEVLYCRALAGHLGPERSVFAIQSPPDRALERACGGIEALSAALAADLCEFHREGPCILAGHSFGGVLAYEVARRLEERGRAVVLVALIDAVCHRDARPADWLRAAPRFLRSLPFWLTDDLLRRSGPCGRARRGRAGSGEQRRLEELHVAAWRRYRPGPWAGRIALFRARARALRPLDPTAEWRRLAGAGVEIHAVPGHHTSLLDEPHVSALGRELRAVLERVE
jgi:amino acid adenylation domain-containing protein